MRHYSQIQAQPTPVIYQGSGGVTPPIDVIILATLLDDFAYVNGDTDTVLSFPNLQAVSTDFTISDMSIVGGVLVTINIPQCNSFNTFQLLCPNLTTLTQFPGATYLGEVTVAVPITALPIVGSTYKGDLVDYSGCANLLAATVNAILAACVASGLSTATIAIGGAAPTGQGIIDKATLIAAGCTVTTN